MHVDTQRDLRKMTRLSNLRTATIGLFPVSFLTMSLFAVVLAHCSGEGGPGSRLDRPNIVLLFADDLGYGDLSSYGHPLIRTPHIDGLGDEGVRFTSFYAMAPSCTPSRAALLTGRYAQRLGLPSVLMPASTGGIPAGEITLAEALKERGYNTAAVGKWHLGHSDPSFYPTQNGFDSYFGILYSNDMRKPWVQTDVPLELYRDNEPIEHPIDQSTLTVRYTQESIGFIESQTDEPFFLYMAYSMPHLPIHTTDEFRGRSPAGLYGDVIETIDWSVGRILVALDRTGHAQNTIVVFTSDNGPWLNLPDRMLQEGNQRWHAGSPGLLRGFKGNTYEGGMRVPAFVRWPGVIPGGTLQTQSFNTMDLFATLVAAAGVTIPNTLPDSFPNTLPDTLVIDGRDIRDALTGKGTVPDKPMFYVRGWSVEAVRSGPWKLRLSNHMRGFTDASIPPTPELFHLELDPSERYNRADEFPDLVAELSEAMRTFSEQLQRSRDRD